MRIIYYLKEDPKPYFFKGSMKQWEEKLPRLSIEKWQKERDFRKERQWLAKGGKK